MPQTQIKKNSRVTYAITLMVLAAIALAGVVYYYYTHQKEPSYGAVFNYQGNNYLIPMTPLTMPIINRQSLLLWASQAATASYTYDAANYKNQFAALLKRYFTKDGGNAFMQALENSGAIDNLLSKKLVVTSVVNGAPLILKQGLLFGVESWRVQVPILVNYQSASETQTASYIITMLIVRTDPTVKPEGIGITQITVNQAH